METVSNRALTRSRVSKCKRSVVGSLVSLSKILNVKRPQTDYRFFLYMCDSKKQPEKVEKLINLKTSEFCTSATFKRRFHVCIQTTMFTVAKSMQTVSWTIVLELQHPETKIYCGSSKWRGVGPELCHLDHDLKWFNLVANLWWRVYGGSRSSSTVKEAAAEEEGETKGDQLFIICDLLQHIMMFFLEDTELQHFVSFPFVTPWFWTSLMQLLLNGSKFLQLFFFKCLEPEEEINNVLASTYFWPHRVNICLREHLSAWTSVCVNICLCEHLSLCSSVSLLCMSVLRYRVVTLMALLIEAFFSPAWLNSNGLRFDFPPGIRQEREHNTHTHTHTNTSRLLGGGGACRMEEQDHHHHHKRWDTDRETTWRMITWLMSVTSSTWTWGHS